MSSYRRRRPPEPRRSGSRTCLLQLVVLIWVVLAVVLGYQYFVRQQVSRQIGRQITKQLGGGTVPGTTAQPDVPGAPGAVGQAGGALPTLVAALPTGEIRVSEEQANAYLAEHAAELQPIESATLRFIPGEIVVDLRALGATSQARMQAQIVNGRVSVVNPRIDGPLSALVDLDDLIGPLEEQLNAELTRQDRTITEVRIEQGELIFIAE